MKVQKFDRVFCNIGELLLRYFIPFLVNILFLHPLKTSENIWFSDVLGGCREKCIKLKWISNLHNIFQSIAKYVTFCVNSSGNEGARDNISPKKEYFL